MKRWRDPFYRFGQWLHGLYWRVRVRLEIAKLRAEQRGSTWRDER